MSNKAYPPMEAIPAQLATIRTVAQNTINIFEETEDPETIQTNLDMIQLAIDYLRGQTIEEKPDEEEIVKTQFTLDTMDNSDIKIISRNGNDVNIEIEGIDVEPTVIHKDLFGEEIENVSEIVLTIPVICGRTYTIIQYNDVLEFYKDDPYIEFDNDTQTWIKTKEYYANRDTIEYSFLTSDMRKRICIFVEEGYIDDEEDNNKEILFLDINTHIHYKENK